MTEINKFSKLRELLVYFLEGGKASRSNAQSVRLKTPFKHVALYCQSLFMLVPLVLKNTNDLVANNT